MIMRTTPFRLRRIGLAALVCYTISLSSCAVQNFPDVAVDHPKWNFHEPAMADTQGVDMKQWKRLNLDWAEDRKRRLYYYLRAQYEREYGFYERKLNNRKRINNPVEDGDELARPEICLALSGGGMRSAAFSIGVMRALHLLRVLDDISIMSGDSGGSYAAGWYIHRMTVEGNDAKRLFGTTFDNGGNLKVMEKDNARNVGNKLGFAVLGPTSDLAAWDFAIPQAIAALAMSPYNILVNGVFKAGVPASPLAYSYESRLSKVFLESEPPNGQRNENVSPVKADKETMVTKQLSYYGEKLTRRRIGRPAKLPFFILNTAAVNRFYDRKVGNDSFNKYFHEAFELAPSHIGSDLNGYVLFKGPDEKFISNDRLGAYNMPLVKAMAISGAAVDFVSYDDFGVWPWLLGAANLNLGQKIKNYSDDAEESQAIQFVPVLNYVDSIAKFKDRSGITDIHLTDGAVSDNYSTYAVIKRLCRKIIMVDAVWDPDFEFKEYKILRGRLQRLGITFRIHEIEEHLDRREKLKKATAAAALKAEASSKDTCPSVVRERPAARHDEVNWPCPVMAGTIRGITYRRYGGKQQTADSEVVYVRLSMITKRAKDGGYGKEAERYVRKTEGGLWQNLGGHFPHEWTVDQNFEDVQFNAYRELGCSVAINAALDSLGKDEITASILRLENHSYDSDLRGLCDTSNYQEAKQTYKSITADSGTDQL